MSWQRLFYFWAGVLALGCTIAAFLFPIFIVQIDGLPIPFTDWTLTGWGPAIPFSLLLALLVGALGYCLLVVFDIVLGQFVKWGFPLDRRAPDWLSSPASWRLLTLHRERRKGLMMLTGGALAILGLWPADRLVSSLNLGEWAYAFVAFVGGLAGVGLVALFTEEAG